jgi:hypothetical protein
MRMRRRNRVDDAEFRTIDRRECRWARRGPAVDSGGDESQDDEGNAAGEADESFGATTEQRRVQSKATTDA